MSHFVSGVDVSDPGIRPVPPERRSLSGVDLAVLWGDLGIGLLVLVAGALLVPALGLATAALAIVVGSVIGVSLLALAGTAGADHGLPTMVLLRPILGVRGSWLPSTLNALQLVGWTAVELWAISLVADVVTRTTFGFSARPLWLLVAAVVCGGLALWGPVRVTRLWLERFGAWVVGAISLLVTVLLIGSGRVSEALQAEPAGGFPTFGQALDLVIAMPISWLPLVADYTRFGRRPRSAFTGTFVGYLIANVWLYLLGAVLVLGADAAPDPAGLAAGILSIAGGSLAGILFLLGLLVGETDEAFADIYSGAVSLQNVFPNLSQRRLVAGITVVGAVLAGWLTMQRYEAFLFLIGSVFVPLFGAFVADHFVVRRRKLDLPALYQPHGTYWFRRGVNLAALFPWVAGFVVYHWIAPTGPAWWTGLVARIAGRPLGESAPWLSASLPSFGVAFLLALIVARLSSGGPRTKETT